MKLKQTLLPLVIAGLVTACIGGKRTTPSEESSSLKAAFGKLQHVVAQFCHASRYGRFVVRGEGGAFQRLVVAVALQLAAPQSAKVHVVAAVSVIQYGGVDAVAASYRVCLGYERPFGRATDGNADTEDVILVFQWKVHVVFAVFQGYVTVP